MKSVSAVLLATLTALTLACGYSAKPATPAVAGTQPTIATLTPDNMNAGGTAFVLTVTGANFASAATINWNSVAQPTTNVSAGQLTATITATDIAAASTVKVTVTNPAVAGTGGTYGTGGTLAETSAPVNFAVN